MRDEPLALHHSPRLRADVAGAAGRKAGAVTLCLGCQPGGIFPPLRAGYVLKGWVLCTQKFPCSPSREWRSVEVHPNSSQGATTEYKLLPEGPQTGLRLVSGAFIPD